MRVGARGMSGAEGRLASGMNRQLTALFSALEALLVIAIGVAIPLVPLTVLWALQYGLQIDWVVFWRVAADLWLLGSGVDLRMTLAPAIASNLAFVGAGTPFMITLAPLGLGLLTVLLGVRAGRRIGETPHRLLGISIGVIVFAAVSFAVTASATIEAAKPTAWQGTVLPTVVFAIGVVIGSRLGRVSVLDLRPDADASFVSSPDRPDAVLAKRFAAGVIGRFGPMQVHYRAVAAVAIRAGTFAVGVVLAASAVIVALLFLSNYATIIALYESVHAGVLGGISLTVGQVALVPNVVIWAASWLVGPGFAIGAGSAVSPLGTVLGPLPAVPILASIPAAGTLAFGFLGLLVPVLAGFAAGVGFRSRLTRVLGRNATLPTLAVTGLLIGVAGGALLGVLAWVSGGAAGPGRLVDVGPSGWLVALWATLEIGCAAVVGLLTARPERSR